MKINRLFPALLLLAGCAGWERDCNSGVANSFGGDWIVLQYGFDGTPINCWKLSNTAISNEEHTDGIFWMNPDGNLVHISGWYNRVQVHGQAWHPAADTLGIKLDLCTGGKYNATKADTRTGIYDWRNYWDNPWAYAEAPIHGTPGRG